LIAEWHITTPHVARRIGSLGRPIARDASVASAPVVNPSVAAGEWPRPGRAALDLEDRRVLVEIPMGFSAMQVRDPALASEWRLSTRAVFQSYFRRGYRAVDFYLARHAARGQYVLAANP
jgi:predicted GNAT superfamily acetyltransferase